MHHPYKLSIYKMLNWVFQGDWAQQCEQLHVGTAPSLHLNAWRVGHGRAGGGHWTFPLLQLPLSWVTLGNCLNRSEVWILREIYSPVQWV